MTDDVTEPFRRREQALLNQQGEQLASANPADQGRAALTALHGRVYATQELSAEFEVLGFLAPYVHVRRKADGAEGSMKFQHYPRFYWGFEPAAGW
jgi:hypothetical protein